MHPIMMRPTPDTQGIDRRLFRAVDYLNDRWMPCDRQLLEKINNIMQHQSDDPECTEQVLDLAFSDVSIFLFTLQRFYRLLSAEGVQIDEDLSPREFILEGGVEMLRLIFEDQTMLETTHTLDAGDDGQKLRLFESAVSASAAQMLAPTYGIESSDGFSGALIRQLGLLLISWNYPTVYAQAVRSQKEGGSLEAALMDKLGFSPQALTVELLHRWGISRKVSRETFGLGGEDAVVNPIRDLYRASEALARANLPELYPSARSDWSQARVEILDRLGAAGLEAIQSALEQHLSHYREHIPSLFRPGLVLDPRKRIVDEERAATLEANPYMGLCTSEIRDCFERIYASIRPGGHQQALLRQILREIIPQAGFVSGCIYTADPDHYRLVPQVAVGSARRQDFHSRDLSLKAESNEIVSLAYLSPQPIVEYHLDTEGACVNRIAGYIGSRTRLGVLYLEMEGDVYDRDPALVLNQFRAIQHALSDCLALE